MLEIKSNSYVCLHTLILKFEMMEEALITFRHMKINYFQFRKSLAPNSNYYCKNVF